MRNLRLLLAVAIKFYRFISVTISVAELAVRDTRYQPGMVQRGAAGCGAACH